ncbi:MAG: hypothetical protein M3247_04040, partial [Thermoproteota archaeon]|nr:hypothetical protein [Thermoproteota archaeon]
DKLNAEPAYRNSFFEDPKAFLERELPGITIDDRLNNEIKAYYTDIKGRISGPNVTYGLTEEEQEYINCLFV